MIEKCKDCGHVPEDGYGNYLCEHVIYDPLAPDDIRSVPGPDCIVNRLLKTEAVLKELVETIETMTVVRKYFREVLSTTSVRPKKKSIMESKLDEAIQKAKEVQSDGS